jgi:hypothetical protein
VDIDGEPHIVKFSRYRQPAVLDRPRRARRAAARRSPSPSATLTKCELYDLTLYTLEERNLAHPTNVDDRSRALQRTMLALLAEQLVAKRLAPSAGETPGYRPPVIA